MLCLPQAMWLTYQAIANAPGLERDQILSLVVPEKLRPSTPQDGAHGKRALDGLLEFGLVTHDAQGIFTAETLDQPADFIRHLRRRLVEPTAGQGGDAPAAPDLRSGLVWLMRESPLVPLHYSTAQSSLPKGLFVNDTRWNAFRWWSQALGFSQPALEALSKDRDQKAKIVPDPTDAVIDAIHRPFGDRLPTDVLLPIGDLLDHLRRELPILPGHPSATYEGLADGGDAGLRALGLALASAEQRGILSMAYQSDPSSVMALPDAQDYGHARYISTVTIKG